jgi:hypothetical protein
VIAVDYTLPDCGGGGGGGGSGSSQLRTRQQKIQIVPATSLPSTGYPPASPRTISSWPLAAIPMGLLALFMLRQRRNMGRRIKHFLRTLLPILIAVLVIVAFSSVPVLSPLAPAAAQGGQCPDFVRNALELANNQCGGIGRNKICYGNYLVNAEPKANPPNFKFDAIGDVTDVGLLRSLRTAAFDEANKVWGIALMRLQADLPNTAPNQNVTVLAFGNVNITDATGGNSSSSRPLQAFYFRTATESNICAQIPSSGILLQSPQDGPKVEMTVNGVKIHFGSTLFLQSQPDGVLSVSTLEGEAEVTAEGVTQVAPAGTSVRVPLDANLNPLGPPAPSETYNLMIMPLAAVEYLPEGIDVSQPLVNPACQP